MILTKYQHAEYFFSLVWPAFQRSLQALNFALSCFCQQFESSKSESIANIDYSDF